MGMDMRSIAFQILSPLLGYLYAFLSVVGQLLAVVVTLFFIGFFIRLRIVPFKTKGMRLLIRLTRAKVKFKPYDFLRWIWWDFVTRKLRSGIFKPYGCTYYCGRQGAGKTVSMVKDLNYWKQKYPKCLIVTNFRYAQADYRMTGWRDLFDIRNGNYGVIFAIDEIHSEYSSAAWKDFPESLLSEISQQRKQRIKIVATTQVFERMAKPLREQAFTVVDCTTYLTRWTFNKEYDAQDYAAASTDNAKKRLKSVKSSFVQSNALRKCYDTYEKIERMKKLEFIPRNER